MEAQLRVPYRDTAADDLVWRLGDPRHPALAALELELAGGLVELRLLGSSHQILFSTPGVSLSEVVACGAGTSGLPRAAEAGVGNWDYRFRSSRHDLDGPGCFERWVDRLVARLARHPSAIVGRFPGSPHAVTALAAGGRRDRTADPVVRWRTWHAYPQERRVVATSTRVQLR